MNDLESGGDAGLTYRGLDGSENKSGQLPGLIIEAAGELDMPNWILAPICLAALVGFIWFAFRQGLSVKPDRHNRDHWDRFGGPPHNQN